MRLILQRIAALLGRTVQTVFGLLGGFVCAFVTSLIAVYLYAAMRYHPLILLAVCFLMFVGCSAGGLLRPRYFCWFSGPLLSVFVGEGIVSSDGDGFSWKDSVATIGFYISLPLLLIGTLFQTHIVFALGVLLFFAYAAHIPSMNAEPLLNQIQRTRR